MFRKFVSYYQTQDSMIFWATCISILTALTIVSMWAFYFPFLPNKIPLFYSLPWGEGQLASLPQFLLLPAIIVLVLLVNLVISWHLHASQLFIKRLLATNTIVIAALIFIAAIKILYIFV